MPQCVNLQFDMLKDSPMHFFPSVIIFLISTQSQSKTLWECCDVWNQ